MEIESPPKSILKNIESFFGTSPDSPCFLPKMNKRRNNAGSFNALLEGIDDSHFNSPTSTLAADLGENFHIQELKHTETCGGLVKQAQTPPLQLQNANTTDLSLAEFSSPLGQKKLSLPQRPGFRNHSNSSTYSSRTTSNLSISSITSISSVSSTESLQSSSMSGKLQQAPIIRQPRALHRAKSSFAGTNSRFLHSQSISNIGFPDLTLNDVNLDTWCVPSPIAEKTYNIDNVNDDGATATDDDDYDEFDFVKTTAKREIGSPLQKKPMRSKVRRIHSMFYSKKEITNSTNIFGGALSSSGTDKNTLKDEFDELNISNYSNLEKSKIEYFYVKNDLIPRIKVETLCKILDGYYKEFFDEIIIVDCRFEYEYKGGHIHGAVNVSSQQELEEKFLSKKSKIAESDNALIVFHCEFSSYRGPLMASHLRTCDRAINQENYPYLSYPNILILEGGYKSFFDLQGHRCFPQKYVEMNDDNHKNTCEKELTRFRRDLKRASSVNALNTSAASSTISMGSQVHRRTITSGPINFNSKRSSSYNLRSQFTADSQRLKKKLSDNNNSSCNSGIKPPESLNFGFKFPLSEAVGDTSSSFSISSTNSSSLTATSVGAENGSRNVVIKKKLSRAFTTYNM